MDAETLLAHPELPGIVAKLMQGHTIASLAGHTRESVLPVYAQACSLYDQGHYEEAIRFFAFLVSIDSLQQHYFIGLGACLQMLKRHRDAMPYYAMASRIDLADPTPVLHTAECLLAVGDHKVARCSLSYALALAKGQANYGHFVPRIEAMLHFLDAAQADTSKKDD